MNKHEDDSSRLLITTAMLNLSSRHSSNHSLHSQEYLSSGYALLIAFETVRIMASVCSVLGVLGNVALICVIAKTSFRHVSYGLLIVVIALFDSVRLLSAIYYYLLFANVVPINTITETIYIVIDRYPIFVVNWCKVSLFDEPFR
jgi:hypothetical protein